jgi:hypothetical protein
MLTAEPAPDQAKDGCATPAASGLPFKMYHMMVIAPFWRPVRSRSTVAVIALTSGHVVAIQGRRLPRDGSEWSKFYRGRRFA